MSIVHSTSVFRAASALRAEVPGLAYYTPEPVKTPATPVPVLEAHRAALEQMFGYYG